MEATHAKLKVHCRWMLRKDTAESIDMGILASRKYAWDEHDLISALRQRNVTAMVAEHEDSVRGFFVYELHKPKILVLNFAVHPTWQRMGVGSQMVDKLKSKLLGNRRAVQIWLRESNLTALLFFKSQGFLAIEIERGAFEQDDGILMEYRI